MAQDNLVIINYQDLLSDSDASFEALAPLLHKAFGVDGNHDNVDNNVHSHSHSHSPESSSALGIIAIRGIPNFVKTKRNLLPLAHKLVHLPSNYLEEDLADEASFYSSGYSHGKEKMGDAPDYSKASFYFNPITDVPGTEEDRIRYPASYPVNKWPDAKRFPGLDLEERGKEMGRLMKDVVVLLAKHVDRYIMTKCHDYRPILEQEMKQTEKVKGRLLYYFPLEAARNHHHARRETNSNSDDHDHDEGEGEGEGENCTPVGDTPAEDSWIGWHNDSGFFTALAGDMYLHHDTGECIPKDQVDPDAGLHIMDRRGVVTQVDIPEDCMAVQIGECLQIISGGKVVATPHCVRGADPLFRNENDEDRWNEKISANVTKRYNVARISFPCFVDTIPSFPLKVPASTNRDNVLQSSVDCAKKVPPLEHRWKKDGMDFGSFLHDTFAMYYEWSCNQK